MGLAEHALGFRRRTANGTDSIQRVHPALEMPPSVNRTCAAFGRPEGGLRANRPHCFGSLGACMLSERYRAWEPTRLGRFGTRRSVIGKRVSGLQA